MTLFFHCQKLVLQSEYESMILHRKRLDDTITIGGIKMVIIREIKTSGGTVHYLLREMESGAERKWYPPRNLKKAQHDDILYHLGTLLEQQVKAKNGAKPITHESEPFTITDSSVRAISAAFLSYKTDDGLAEYTRANWQSCLRARILPAIGEMPIREVRPKHILLFLNSLKKEGLAHSTVVKYYLVLQQLFAYAKTFEEVDEDIMLKVERPAPRKDEPIAEMVTSYTADTIKKIMCCLEREPIKWQAYIRLLSVTGMRRGECLGISWDDVDFSSCTITVRNNVGRTKEKGLYITTTKNRQTRVVDVDRSTMFVLLQLFVYRQGPWVFANAKDPSLPMSPTSPNRYFSKFGKKYGIEQFHPHKLRHSFASISITNGADICSVSEILGHHNASFTMKTYPQSNPTQRKQVSNIYNDAIQKAEVDLASLPA